MIYVLPLEIKVRDFDSRLYLALKLLADDENSSCIIGDMYEIHPLIRTIEATLVYFSKGLNPWHIKTYKSIKKNNGFIMYLEEEGAVSSKNTTGRSTRYSQRAINYCDRIFSWGIDTKNFIMDTVDFKSDDIIVSGHPRFDIRKKRFNSFYRGLRKHNEVYSKSYILVNTSFGMYNTVQSKNETHNEYKNAFEYRLNRKTDFSNYFNHMFQYQKEVFKKYIDMIKKLAEINKDLFIVVRPHPIENILNYKKYFIDINNVIVDRSGSVQEWIVDAKAIIHHDCTTSIEAYFNKKYIITYMPIEIDSDIESFIHIAPMYSGNIINDEDKLVTIIKQIYDDNYYQEYQPKTEIIQQYYSNLNFEATDVIIEHLNKMLKQTDKSISKDFNVKLHNIFKVNIKTFMHRLYRNIVHHARHKVIKNKFDGLSKKEIEKRISLFRKFDNTIPKIKVDKLTSNSYLLIKE